MLNRNQENTTHSFVCGTEDWIQGLEPIGKSSNTELLPQPSFTYFNASRKEDAYITIRDMDSLFLKIPEISIFKNNSCWAWCHIPLTLALRSQREVGLYEFKDSQVYRSNFQDRQGSIQRNPDSKNI